MKFGLRKISPRKSFSARYSGKRIIKNKIGWRMPRGYGWVKNPNRYSYNRIYHKVTFSIFDFIRILFGGLK